MIFIEVKMSNIIKQTTTKLEVTVKELANLMGVAEGTIRNWGSKDEVPEWAVKFMELLIKNHKQEKILYHFKEAITELQKQ
jgi:DNA-binding transcriptional regulator YiaG